MKEWKIPFNERNILDALLTGTISKKLSRQRRIDKRKILGFGSAAYHQIAAQPNPKKILNTLADSVGVNIDRISNPCRIIVECFVDYGATKEERQANRQYATRDARALSYIIRTGMTPEEVMNPGKGESVTVWANREADYRLGQRVAAKPAKMVPEKEVLTEPLPRQLATLSLTQAAYNAIVGMVDQGVLVVNSKGGGKAFALAIAPLNSLTAEKAVCAPGKVRKAIRKAVNKSRQKTSRSENNSDW